MRLLLLIVLLVVAYWLMKFLFHHLMFDRMMWGGGCGCGCVGKCKCPLNCPGCGCKDRYLGNTSNKCGC